MKVGVKIMPRLEVLDSQGRAVEQTLRSHGLNLESCRVGKYVELDIDTSSRAEAETRARKIAEFVLVNPLIEKYEFEFPEAN